MLMFSHLHPLVVRRVNGLRQLWIVQVKQVWPDTDDRAVFVMELLDGEGVTAGTRLGKPPEVCVPYSREVVRGTTNKQSSRRRAIGMHLQETGRDIFAAAKTTKRV
jgi:hypothetical protein